MTQRKEFSIIVMAIVVLVLATLFVTDACGQANHRTEPFKLFNRTDAVYWTGSILDAGFSLNKRELNPLWRDSDGIFAPGKNLAFKGGIWGAFKLLESRYSTPKERRVIGWCKIGIGAGFGVFAIRNSQVRPIR